MVYHRFPQSAQGEVATNTNFPPQNGGMGDHLPANTWVDNLGDEFVTDTGEIMVFSS